MSVPIPVDHVEKKIYLIRRQRVMLDRDLAQLYVVPTRRLNEQVSRNRERFPGDFMFQLTPREVETHLFSRSQNATLNVDRRGTNVKYLPYVFTEEGVAMLSGVLKSRRAAIVNVAIMRAFVKLRQMVFSHEDLARKIRRLESRYDARFRVVFMAIKRLMTPPRKAKPSIGFIRH